jgi:hypothetical protein
MVTGVIVTVTGTVTNCPKASVTVTLAEPAATASIVIGVEFAVEGTGEVTVTTPVALLATVYAPR